MSALELIAGALIVASLVVCIVAIVASAADAARVAARRVQARAEQRVGEHSPPPPSASRSRGPHSGPSSTPRPPGGRRLR